MHACEQERERARDREKSMDTAFQGYCGGSSEAEHRSRGGDPTTEERDERGMTLADEEMDTVRWWRNGKEELKSLKCGSKGGTGSLWTPIYYFFSFNIYF